jgi:hypothetical protein
LIRPKIRFFSQQTWLRGYRLAMLALMVWLVRDHHERVRIKGDSPVRLAEAAAFFTNAASLRLDTGPRQGWEVLDAGGGLLGYVVRTQPQCRKIIGYCGVTDTLIAISPDGKIKGLKVRASEDTIRHVEDVATDRRFLKKWNGMPWEAAAQMDLQKAGIEGVSGATQTSMAIAQSVVRRLALAQAQPAPLPWQVKGRDVGLACLIALGLALTFWRGKHQARLRRVYQALVVVYLGFVNGDLIAQSLLAGWTKSGLGWRLAPGLVLLVTAAFVIPWATRRPWYCQQVCPYGILQEWTGRLGTFLKWRWQMPPALDVGLRRLPAALLAVILVVVLWQLPLDLVSLEPFDAFLWMGGATLGIAIAGLIAALFLPQPYCRYGCPTGALLEFVRSRGPTDRFGPRDWFALLLVLLGFLLAGSYDTFALWLNR